MAIPAVSAMGSLLGEGLRLASGPLLIPSKEVSTLATSDRVSPPTLQGLYVWVNSKCTDVIRQGLFGTQTEGWGCWKVLCGEGGVQPAAGGGPEALPRPSASSSFQCQFWPQQWLPPEAPTLFIASPELPVGRGKSIRVFANCRL